MLAVKKENEEAFLKTQLGTEAEVLLESHFTVTPISLRAEGYTRNYTPVYIDFDPDADKESLKGKILHCKLTGITNGHMIAKPIE